jgi:histidine triad (HIT) family protein
MTHADCVFCKIAAGALPSCRVYEDADTLAFLDIGPVAKGHTLVVPRLHCDPLTEAPDGTLQKLIVVVKQVVRAQLAGLGADGVNVTQANGRVAGQIVPHVHFHVIPRFARDGMPSNWNPRKYDNPAEMEDFGRRLRGAMPGNEGVC